MSLAIQTSTRPAVAAAGFPMSGRSPATLSQPSNPDLALSVPAPPAAAAPAKPALNETQLERLVKLVPADVIALYIPAIGLGTLTTWPYYALAVTIGATLLVPLLLYLDARSAGHRVPLLQYGIRTFAFIAWAFVIAQPLAPYKLDPVIPALLALVFPILGERFLR